MKYSLIILMFILIPMQALVSTIPLTLSPLIIGTILLKKSSVLIVATICGYILDALSFRPVGLSSVFFLIILSIIMLYQRKFEINKIPFVATVSFVASILYLIIFQYQSVFFSACITTGFSAILWVIFTTSSKKTAK